MRRVRVVRNFVLRRHLCSVYNKKVPEKLLKPQARSVQQKPSPCQHDTVRPTPIQMTDRPSDIWKRSSPLRVVLEPGRSTLNYLLKTVDSPIRLSLTTSAEDKLPSSPPMGTGKRKAWQADSIVSKEDVLKYVDLVLYHKDSEVNNPLLPGALERQLYSLVVRVVLHLMHSSLGSLDATPILGRILSVQQQCSPTSKLKRSSLNLDLKVIDAITRATATRRPIVSSEFDRLIYGSTIRFALRLVSDIISSSQATVFGVKIAFDVTPCAETLQAAITRDWDKDWDEVALRKQFGPIVDDLLADKRINLAFVPDHLEEELYFAIIHMLLNVAGAGAGELRLDIFGIQANFGLK